MELDSRDMGGDGGEQDNMQIVISSIDLLFLLIASVWAVLPLEHREVIAMILGRQSVALRRTWREKGVPSEIAEKQLARLSDLCSKLRASEPNEDVSV